MKKWQTASGKNVLRVQALFEKMRQAAPGAGDTDWLDALERDAKDAKPGWRERFEAWLLGLEQARGVSAAVAEEWRREADACLTIAIRPAPVVFCLLWTLLVVLTTLGWQSKLVGQTQAIVGCAATALTGVIWARRSGWMAGRGRASARWWEQGVIAAIVGVGAIFLGVIVPGLYADLAKQGAYMAFKRQQNVFTTASSGYPWIRDFAKREFGVDVVMNAPESTWARTTLQTVGTSPAFMSTGNGFCELSISPESIHHGFASPVGQVFDKWVQGIMMHELAHCLDVRRDYAGQGGAWTGMHSIAPADRHDVQSGPSHYRVASEREPTQLWREALADMMAVGYWRLNTTPAAWKSLTKGLRATRQATIKQDPTHATVCWIDLAAGAKGPASNQQIFAWADDLRSADRCKTTSR